MAKYAWTPIGSSDDPWYCPSSCSSTHSDSVLNNDNEMENVYVPFPEHANRLVLCHQNIRSLFPKTHQLHLFLDQCKQQNLVLAISETWLDSTITDSVVALPGYDIHRRQKQKRRRCNGVCQPSRVASEGWTLKMMSLKHYGLKLRSVNAPF